ncbi:pentatricopeptide repeat-containing protein [Quercus suber]|uniref:Pentatricopeptide repeat-containing protein n=1 Tax=Quercus suber TaxID=58331 RepID=A0AAW0M6L2_QUESU
MHPLIRRFSSTVDPTLSIPAIHCKIRDYVSEGLYNETLELYKEELHPLGLYETTSIFIPSIIKACSHAQSYHFGLQLHCMALKTGSDSEAIISNSLVSMYAKFSITEAARQVFDTMPHRDTISWNSMINCYLQNGYCGDALEMFKEMYMCGFEPKPELIAAIVSACAKKGEFRLGRQIHGLVIVDGMIKESVFLSTALVDFYLRCHDSLVALQLGYIEHGKEIHGYAFRHGFDADHHFSAALIHMYCKFQETLHSAEIIFEKSIIKDVVMWSLIIGSYAQSRNSSKAMNLFSQMQMQGIEPNSVTLLAILSICTSLSSLKHGCGVHGYILKSGLNFDIFIENALINMYAKCGCLMASHQIFKEMPTRDCTSWSTLISGYGLHGCGEEALQLFHEMQDKGMKPDSMTFLALLSTCNHTGLVEEGRKIFDCVMKDDKIPLTVEHYACFIDLLGRSGKLDDACEVVRAMPMKPSTKIWSSLVSACKVHGRLEIAEKLALWLIESEPDNAANYTMLSMVYAEAGNWPGVEEVRRLTRVQGLKKCYAFSRIELEHKSFSSSRNNQQL